MTEVTPAAGPAEPVGRPSVSVVVPTRDRPELLARAVRAILGQDYAGPVECVVVFDRCDPVLPSITLGPQRSLVGIPNDRTPGLAGARNTGTLAASGELLAFCDDDDEWLPRKLSVQVDTLERRPDAVAVGSGIYVHYGHRVITRIPEEAEITFRDLLRSRRTELHSSNILARRADYVGRLGLVDETLPGSHAEDTEWLMRATRHGPIAVAREPLVRIYWNQPSWFAGRFGMLASALRILLERFPEFREDPTGAARMYGQIAFYHAAAGERRVSWEWIRRCLRTRPWERRGYLAAAVNLRLVSAERLLRMAHRFGKGI